MSLEYCTFQLTGETKVCGQVIGDMSGTLGRVNYEVRCAQDGSTQGVAVQFSTLRTESELELQRETNGIWKVRGEQRADLANCLDVDIGVTPSTNAMAIRRLRLQLGESRALTVAWLRFPEFKLTAMRQRYTRIGDNTYLYESLESGYKAELTVDDDGIVQTYGSEWEIVTDS